MLNLLFFFVNVRIMNNKNNTFLLFYNEHFYIVVILNFLFLFLHICLIYRIKFSIFVFQWTDFLIKMKHKFMCNINIIFIKKTKILCLNLNKYKIERFFFNFYNFF